MTMVNSQEAEGATIRYVGMSTIDVLTQDGRILEIHAEYGHSGIELNVYDVTPTAKATRKEEPWK